MIGMYSVIVNFGLWTVELVKKSTNVLKTPDVEDGETEASLVTPMEYGI